MNRYTCSICKRIFTRDWNLKRHMQDVHRLADYAKKDYINQEIEENNHYSSFHSNSFYKENNMDFYNNYKQNPPYYSNFSNDFSNSGYYNNYPFPYSNFNSQIKENRKLTIDDKIRIQKALKILENSLSIFYPKAYAVGTTSWLRYRCFREQSDEPLKNYLVNRNMGDLWPY